MSPEDAMDGQCLEAYHFYEREWESYGALCEAFEWEVPDSFNIAHYICDRWANDGTRPALFAEHESGWTEEWTFAALRDRANQFANYLEDQGVGVGDRVAINLAQRPETAVAHLGCWKLGAVSVPLSVKFGPDALRYRLENSGAVAAVVGPRNRDSLRAIRAELSSVAAVLTVDAEPGAGETAFAGAIDPYSTSYETVDTAAEDPAVLIYTSGTTGDPKGVLHAHRFLLGHLPVFVTDFCNMRMHDDDRFWLPSEWSWIAVFDIVIPAWFYGKPAVSYDSGAFKPEAAFELIDRYDITVSFFPPTALRMMRAVEETDAYGCSSLRVIATGGEALDRSTYQWISDTFGPDIAVHEGYGQTEANMLIANCEALDASEPGKIGVPGPGHTITLLDPETGEPDVPTGTVGEIAVRYADDPVCFLEYWNTPVATDEKVQDGWLLTEDLGRVDEGGFYEFAGRTDDVIISAGYRIGPEEIEESLTDHPAVVQAGVVGRTDEERGEVPIAYVELAPEETESAELIAELQRHVKSRLARYEYPREIIVLEEVPKTTTGKVQRSALDDPD